MNQEVDSRDRESKWAIVIFKEEEESLSVIFVASFDKWRSVYRWAAENTVALAWTSRADYSITRAALFACCVKR